MTSQSSQSTQSSSSSALEEEVVPRFGENNAARILESRHPSGQLRRHAEAIVAPPEGHAPKAGRIARRPLPAGAQRFHHCCHLQGFPARGTRPDSRAPAGRQSKCQDDARHSSSVSGSGPAATMRHLFYSPSALVQGPVKVRQDGPPLRQFCPVLIEVGAGYFEAVKMTGNALALVHRPRHCPSATASSRTKTPIVLADTDGKPAIDPQPPTSAPRAESKPFPIRFPGKNSIVQRRSPTSS